MKPRANSTRGRAASPRLTDARAVIERLRPRFLAAGSFSGPCLPALVDYYLEKFLRLFDAIGRPLSIAEAHQFGQGFLVKLEEGFAASPHARFLLAYRPSASSVSGIDCTISITIPTLGEQYQEWLTGAAGERPFGREPDARVMDVARSHLSEGSQRALDAGAGDGRNALPLARLGYEVTALEPVAELAAQLRTNAEQDGLCVQVLEQDLLAIDARLESSRFDLIVLSEVLPHFSNGELAVALERLASCLAPGGTLLFNALILDKGYTPDVLAMQAAQSVWSSFSTRARLNELTLQVGLQLVSDHSCVEYEKAHLPPGAWPPTPWYVNWASGHNLFALGAGRAPLELRWLEYRRPT